MLRVSRTDQLGADSRLREAGAKLGIPLEEQKVLAGVAVDAVFDSVSVATTFKDKLEELGITEAPKITSG